MKSLQLRGSRTFWSLFFFFLVLKCCWKIHSFGSRISNSWNIQGGSKKKNAGKMDYNFILWTLISETWLWMSIWFHLWCSSWEQFGVFIHGVRNVIRAHWHEGSEITGSLEGIHTWTEYLAEHESAAGDPLPLESLLKRKMKNSDPNILLAIIWLDSHNLVLPSINCSYS